MKTIEYFLKMLPEPYASQAIENTEKDLLKCVSLLKNPEGALSAAFRWDESPEGFDYWSKAQDKLMEKYN